jgi:hypothetical protein
MKEIVKEAFDILESRYLANWRSGKGSRDNLEKAFADITQPVHLAAGYKGSDGIRHAMGRAMPTLDKPKEKEWRAWLFSLVGYSLCPQCKTLKEPKDVSTNGYRCKSCDASRSRTSALSNRKLLFEYQSRNPCKDCGEKDPIVLEFDHKVPELKEYNISNMMGYSWDKIKTEIDKCDVVCANCHRRRTAIQQGWYNF